MLAIFLVIAVLFIVLMFREVDRRIQKQKEDELAAKRRFEEKKRQEQKALAELEKKKKLAEEERLRQSLVYKSHFHKVVEPPARYMLFDTNGLDYQLTFLYKKVVHQNLWINEPFHTKFFQFLMLFNNNEFMIVDDTSEVITMYIRDANNVPQKSEAYQVYSTKDIVSYVMNYTLSDIKSFNDADAQNCVIAIFIYALMQSVHYSSYEVAHNTINKLLHTYEYKINVEEIVALIEEDDPRYEFISDAFQRAFLYTQTLPYNNSESPKQVELPLKLPQKYLQRI